MIKIAYKLFVLHTLNTTYAFRIMDCGLPEHLYYGKRIRLSVGADALYEKFVFPTGNTCMYTQDEPGLTLQNVCLEFSSEGKGDMREAAIQLVYEDGSMTSDFRYVSAEKLTAGPDLTTLPCSYDDEGKVEGLRVILADKYRNQEIELTYYVYYDEDVITRTVRLKNNSDKKVRLQKLMSGQVDYADSSYRLTSFKGAWAREMRRVDTDLVQGSFTGGSFTGTSSALSNPFFMLSSRDTTEDMGDVWGFNLVYSGNHLESAEVNEYGKTRLLWGINPRAFSFSLEPGDSFEAPEAVMTYSYEGFNGMSRNMHSFVRKHIVRGYWRDRVRPVLLNSWEAAYFKINEDKLLKLAKAGKSAGIELFVMDDGWFGERNDDTSSLGDWEPNKAKLPGGVKRIAEKITKLGMKFGLWVEPEMINVKSKLYEKHPDWVMDIPDQPHCEGRNQRLLDLSNEAVQDHIIEAMTKNFGSGDISYVKWDFNRNFSDIFSRALPAEKQGEVCHRYVMGLYRVMKTLTERFPQILFEGCASGGNRFDLGILSFFPQIWGSDDTDAVCRTEIQTGYSYGYPLSTVGAHVSGVPNHQTLRVTPLATRFNVAAFGVLGYELNLSDLEKEELDEVRKEIALYKEWREVFFKGSFYRGRSWFGHANSALSPLDSNVTEWTVVSEDKTRAASLLFQNQTVPNNPFQYIKPKGLDDGKLYRFYNIREKLNIMDFGDLVNTVAPVHIRQGSMAHELIAKFVKMDGELEDFKAYGVTLKNAGVKLSPAYGGTGFNDKTRAFPDYSSRLYFMEESELDTD